MAKTIYVSWRFRTNDNSTWLISSTVYIIVLITGMESTTHSPIFIITTLLATRADAARWAPSAPGGRPREASTEGGRGAWGGETEALGAGRWSWGSQSLMTSLELLLQAEEDWEYVGGKVAETEKGELWQTEGSA